MTGASVLIVGIGNPFRSDDGAGRAALAELHGRLPAGCRALEHSGEAVSLMEAWRGSQAVVLMDASSSGRPPGTLLRLDASTLALPDDLMHCSTHAFGAAAAIEMARALDALPPRVIVWVVEGKTFEPGESLTPEVARALPELARRVLEEAERIMKEVAHA